jgi:PII-like signaling protein
VKLSVYHGERDRFGSGFMADALAALFARHELRVSLVMRGIAGFGLGQHLRTDRQLTLSEDLTLVSVAVDSDDRIAQALLDVEELPLDGLVTLERTDTAGAGAAKLTVYAGRGDRPRAIVEVLHAAGVAGATVLVGVDGTVHGVRRRARLLGSNAEVPLMVVAVGEPSVIAAARSALAEDAITTLERVRVCKRDGETLAAPRHPPDTDPSGLSLWQKIMVFGGPDHTELLLRLRRAGAAGGTSLRGLWGYHGDHAPHGDSWRRLRRGAPVITVMVDTPAAVRDWYPIVDELTAAGGLVTSEIVPAYRASQGDHHHGGLRLAERWAG